MSRLPATAALGVLAWFSYGAWMPGAAAISSASGSSPSSNVQTPVASAIPSDADIERFLLNAKVVKSRSAGKGITGSLRATLTDGTLTHDAHIQMIDESKREFQSSQGVELNFRDSWTFNIAAYRIDRLLGLNLIPVSVERRWRTASAAYTWWVDDVMMDEADRLKKHLSPPNVEVWNQQMQLVRVFDQLIANTDRNLGNLLITSDWRVWAIDHTRAFRMQPTLKAAENIKRCDRKVFERLKQLDRDTVKKVTGGYLQAWDIDALLKRRDAIVVIIEKQGPAGLFDRDQ
jgi:hypothetical protein